MKNLLITLVMTFGSTGMTIASDWRLIGRDDPVLGTTLKADADSITKKNGYVVAWFLRSLPAPIKLKDEAAGRTPSQTYQSVKVLTYFKCAEREGATGPAYFYAGPNGTGAVIFSHDTTAKHLSFEPVVPDSKGALVLEAICKFYFDKALHVN